MRFTRSERLAKFSTGCALPWQFRSLGLRFHASSIQWVCAPMPVPPRRCALPCQFHPVGVRLIVFQVPPNRLGIHALPSVVGVRVHVSFSLFTFWSRLDAAIVLTISIQTRFGMHINKNFVARKAWRYSLFPACPPLWNK